MCQGTLKASGPRLLASQGPGRRALVVRALGAQPAKAQPTSAVTSSDGASLLELGWKNDIYKDYVRGPCLGVGSFGSVYQGVQASTGDVVAIKILPKERPRLSRAKVLEKLNRELNLLDRLSDSPRVVQLLDCYEDEAHVYLVTEACLGGDLQRYSETYGALTERCLALVALEILSIVQSCHRFGVLHGDVKPANFCVKDEYRHPYCASHAALFRTPWLKAIDFGCSQMHFRNTRLTKRSGTPVYMAPEIFRRDYSFEVDVWSTGVTLYQLFCRRFPFWDGDSYSRALSLDEVAKAITEADIRLDFGPWLTMSSEGLDFIRGCLTRDPALRMTLEEALTHPWLEMYAGSEQPQVVVGPLVEVSVANNIVRNGGGAQAGASQQRRRNAALAA